MTCWPPKRNAAAERLEKGKSKEITTTAKTTTTWLSLSLSLVFGRLGVSKRISFFSPYGVPTSSWFELDDSSVCIGSNKSFFGRVL